MAKKQIVFKVPRGMDAYALAEELRKATQSQFSSLEIQPAKIVVRLYGDSVSVERSLLLLKESYKKAVERHRMVSGRRIIVPKDKVASVLGRPLPLDVVTDALKLVGIPFEERPGELVIKIPYEELRDYVRKLYDSYASAKDIFSGSARRVASVVSAVWGLDLETVRGLGIREGVFRKVGEKCYLAVNPESAYEILSRSVSSIL